MPLILPARTLDSSYEISNSLRFNDDDNPSLSRANDSGGSNTAGTLSFWTKRSEIDTGYLFFARSDDSNVFNVYFSGNERLEVRSTQGGTAQMSYKTNALFRDPSAWYHIVIAVDTTDGTAGDRCKVFVNGSRITSFETQTNFGSSNTIELFQSDATVYVTGEFEGGTIANPYDGYIADLNFVDGTQYDASYFGETNDNGVWIPKRFSGTQGTNGFRLEFKQTGTSANASGMGADTSGNGNHLTPSNLTALDVTTDTPTNNFATMNPLDNAVLTLSEGNTKATHSSSSGGEENRATLGAANGKWYFEFQVQHTVGSLNPFALGMMSNTGQNPLQSDLKTTEAFTSAWHTDGSSNKIESRVSGSKTELNCNLSYPDNGDIINVAMDLDNGRVYFGKNGTYINDASGNTGNPSTGANPPVSFTTGGHFYFPAIHNRGSQGLTVSLNTGNPSFSISSGNADANGYGNFEYAVPSGYYSLCTKNLAEYG